MATTHTDRMPELLLSSLFSQQPRRQTGILRHGFTSQAHSHLKPGDVEDSQVAIVDASHLHLEHDISNPLRGSLLWHVEVPQSAASKAWGYLPHEYPASDSPVLISPAPSQPSSPLPSTKLLPNLARDDPPLRHDQAYPYSHIEDKVESTMGLKKHRSLQPLFVPPFIRPASPPNASPSSATRQRSLSAAATTFTSTCTSVSDNLEIPPAIPIVPADKSSEYGEQSNAFSSLRNSPPSDLLDDDPFANLTQGPSVITVSEISTPGGRARSASLPRLRTSLDFTDGHDISAPLFLTPRSPLAQSPPLLGDGTKSLGRAAGSGFISPDNSLPPTPPSTPRLSGNRTLRSHTHDRVGPAYTRLAFRPRPSLPSLHALAQAQVIVQPKLRRGRVGATLPFEPWESQLSQAANYEPSESERLAESAALSRSVPSGPQSSLTIQAQAETLPRPSGPETVMDSKLVPEDVDGSRNSFGSLTSSDSEGEILDAQQLWDSGFVDSTNGFTSADTDLHAEHGHEPLVDPVVQPSENAVELPQGIRPSHLRRPSGLSTIRDSRLIVPEHEGEDEIIFTESPTEMEPSTPTANNATLSPEDGSQTQPFSQYDSHPEHGSEFTTLPSTIPAPPQNSAQSTSQHRIIPNAQLSISPPSQPLAITTSSPSFSPLTKREYSCDSPFDPTFPSLSSAESYSSDSYPSDPVYPTYPSYTGVPRRSLCDDLSSTLEYDYADVIARLGPSPTHGCDSDSDHSHAHRRSQHEVVDEFEPGTSADTIRRLSSLNDTTFSHSHIRQRSSSSAASNLSLTHTLELEWIPSFPLGTLSLPLSPSSMTSMTSTTESSDELASYEPSSSTSSEYGHAHGSGSRFTEGEGDGYATDSFLSFESDSCDEDDASVYRSAVQSVSSPPESRSASLSASASQMVTPPMFEDDLDLADAKAETTMDVLTGNGKDLTQKAALDSVAEDPITPSAPRNSPNVSRTSSRHGSKRKLSKSSSIQSSLRQLFRMPSDTDTKRVSLEPLNPEPTSPKQTLEMLSSQSPGQSGSNEVVDAGEAYQHKSGAFQSSISGTGFSRSGGHSGFPGSNGLGGSGGSGGRRGQDDDDRQNRRLPAGSSGWQDSDTESEDESDYGEERSPSVARKPRDGSLSSDDDVPLAQQIPTALKAQKSIRLQVRDESRRKRLEKKLAAATSREKSSPAPPAVPALDQRSMSTQQPAKPVVRARTKTLPSNTAHPFSLNELTSKLLSVQSQVSRRPSEEIPRRSPRDPSIEPPPLPNQSRFPEREYVSAPVARSQTVNTNSATRTLRTARSFHRPRTEGEEMYAPPPLPNDTMGGLGRSVTSRSRRGRDMSQPPPSPMSPFTMKDGGSGLGRERSTRSHSHRPSFENSQPPVSLDRAISGKAQSRRPSLEENRQPTLERARSGRSHSRRPSLDDESRRAQSRPPMPPLPSAEVVSSFASPPPPPPPKPVQLWQQRIFVGSLQSFCAVEVHAGTTAGDVLRILESQRALPGGGTQWMLWELCQDFGMERPIRSFELLTDITASWNTEKTVNVFLARETELQPKLSRSAIPTSSPVIVCSVQYEYKRGKWQKRRIELREHGLWLSKKDTGKDETFLCSVSNFDAYFVTRPTKAPKSFVFSIKSTDNLSFFENTADYMHNFACDKKDGQPLVEKILLARSYYLYQERNVLPNNTMAPSGGAALSRSGTRKTQRPAQPLVNFGGVPATGDVPPVPAVFEPGSLLAKRGV